MKKNKKSIEFYIYLFFKKFRTKLHNLLEEKVSPANIIDDKLFLNFLINRIKTNLVETNKGIYYKTRVMNNGLPMNLAQARVLLGLSNLYKNNQFNNLTKMQDIQKYILSLKTKEGIFKFNQKKWNLQDEGIATVWVLLSLIKLYKINPQKDILDEIKNISKAMNNLLVDEKNSLLHTLGDNYWCLNAASTYAYFAKEFFEIEYDETIYNNYLNSINICVKNFSKKNYFPYSEKNRGTYLLLYNPIVIFTLEEALKYDKIPDDLKLRTIEVLHKSKDFLIDQMDEKGFFVEPEFNNFSRYIISNITSLVALKGYLTDEKEKLILNNVMSFLIKDKLYLCCDDSNKYFDGNLYEVSDVLLTEVFYWFTNYLN